jgi:hypothetical protein
MQAKTKIMATTLSIAPLRFIAPLLSFNTMHVLCSQFCQAGDPGLLLNWSALETPQFNKSLLLIYSTQVYLGNNL